MNAREVVAHAQQLRCILCLVAGIQIRIPERDMHRFCHFARAAQLAAIFLGAVDFKRTNHIDASLNIAVAAFYKIIKMLINILLAARHQQAVCAFHAILRRLEAETSILD